MEDLNARTESVIGDDTEDTDANQSSERIVTGDPQVDDEPEELKKEQPEETEMPLEPDDPE